MAGRLNHAPKRLRVVDELGAVKTLAPGHDVVQRAAGTQWLILGLGPDPGALAEALPFDARVGYLECPAFFGQTDAAWRAGIPEHWQHLTSFELRTDTNVLLYRFALQLFPSFWGSVRAALLLPHPAKPAATGRRTALLAAKKNPIVAPETALALRAEGFDVYDGTDKEQLLQVLEHRGADLFLSINFAGLDRHGEIQALLARAGVPTAVWCVDNPFHALSGVKTTAWRELHLFVTDDWFLTPLREHGARHVRHLPLAANPDFFRATPDQPTLDGKLLFVGHSAFPDKKLFFSGISLNKDIWNQAQAMLAAGNRPDFSWWVRQLGLETLWPGLQVRRAGFGAEESGLAWRTLVIKEAARSGKLTVCGDEAWGELETERPFLHLPCVNYYGPLAGMYASARYVVGAVSPLLPHGLTQRHFDVWAAGGCLLTDATPGLTLFPDELTKPITYATAREIPDLAHGLERDRDDLIRAWSEHIAREHTYGHRIRAMLQAIQTAREPGAPAP